MSTGMQDGEHTQRCARFYLKATVSSLSIVSQGRARITYTYSTKGTDTERWSESTSPALILPSTAKK